MYQVRNWCNRNWCKLHSTFVWAKMKDTRYFRLNIGIHVMIHLNSEFKTAWKNLVNESRKHSILSYYIKMLRCSTNLWILQFDTSVVLLVIRKSAQNTRVYDFIEICRILLPKRHRGFGYNFHLQVFNSNSDPFHNIKSLQ